MGKKLRGVMNVVSAAAVAAVVTKKYIAHREEKKEREIIRRKSYRNTERGKDAKNTMGVYYTSGNYEAFAKPERPEGIENKSAWIIGSGIAALSAACYLVRDAQMNGKQIHILEALKVPGGSCDGVLDPSRGFVMRGGREMDNHFEVMWDLMRSIPSLEEPGLSVLDEYYRLNKHDPNYSLCRATVNRGNEAHTDGKFDLSDKGAMEIMKLFFASDEELFGKTIEDVFDDEVLGSTFWMYWRTMFAFNNWHSALEMKRYIQRYIHHVRGLPDFSALRFTRYNQYDSLVLPMVEYLREAQVDFRYGIRARNVIFEKDGSRRYAREIKAVEAGEEIAIPLTENDLVFITNGSCTEGTYYGDQDHAPDTSKPIGGGCWELWKNIAVQDSAYGHPEVFCSDSTKTTWESASLTTSNTEIIRAIKKICHRDPLARGRIVTGGIVTARDSNWLLSWTINRQGQFKEQPDGTVTVWIYGLLTDRVGNYVNKPMKECTGREITEEWLYHIGIPEEDIERVSAEDTVCVPTLMPFITAFFMPRCDTDRPKVIPDGAQNFAFIGQFAELPRDTIFTIEYSYRTGMVAAYGLCNVDRGIPEVWGSVYDVRCLIDASVALLDGKSPLDVNLGVLNILKRPLLKAIAKTDIEKLLKEYGVI